MDALSDAEATARIGRLVDERYKILEPMASGSMGAVFKAERVPVGKLVAIKFLHASFAKDTEFQLRFERETRVMSRLAHTNCVSVLDFGVWEGAPYLVMEYVAGTTLRAVIDTAPIPPQRALALVRQIAAGLAHAHAEGVVHRDIKPANIMITEEIGTGDHVRILDFGLARLRGNVGRDATQTNVVVGTPNYMAPEQTIGGGTIDARTDIYAVGVVLFEMIAGQRPFSSEDTLQLLGMHRAAPTPQLADRIDHSIILPDGLQELIERAMAKSPDDRFQTAIELSQAIDVLIGPRTSTEFKVPTTRRERARTDPAASAPTMLDLETARTRQPTELQRTHRSSSLGGLVLLLVFLGGAGAAVWLVKLRPTATPTVGQGSAEIVAGAGAADASPALASPVDAQVAAVADAAADAPVDAAVDATIDAGIASALDEIEMDPLAATNPDPDADAPGGEDEAPDAPATAADVERRVPAAPVLATTVRQAVQMIQAGKRDLALASLRALWKKSPNSGYIPFLLGNLYNDRLWWSVALDHYKIAITKSSAYKGNATLNKNVIRMLASSKTQRKASTFLRWTIGRPARPHLRWAAKHEKNATVRSRAAGLAKAIR